MPTINLLPWREQLRERKKREFFAILGGFAVIMILVVLVVHLAISHSISIEKKKIKYLKKEIKVLDKQIKEIEQIKQQKENLIARMNVIQELQASRLIIVHLFEELVNTVPPGVYFDRINRNKNRISITGRAESNSRVSALMRNTSASPWLQKPVLSEIKISKDGKDKDDIRRFSLRVYIEKPKKPGEEDDEDM